VSKWRPNNKVTFNRWEDCDRCGFSWPVRELKRQKGALVCPECLDDPGHEDAKREGELRDPEGRQSFPWVPDQEEGL